MSESSHMGNISGGEWFTVAEVAAHLQVSERTIKRRIAAKEYPARYEPLPTGGRRRLVQLPASGTSTEDTRAIVTGDKKDNERDKSARSPSATASSFVTGDNERDTGDKSDTGERDTGGSQVATLKRELEAARAEAERLKAERDREREEVLFLRDRVAELNAMVMQTARALPAQTSEPLILDAPPVATSPGSQASPEPRPAVIRPQRAHRPFWAVLLGIRPKR
jgi:hypothetical protein